MSNTLRKAGVVSFLLVGIVAAPAGATTLVNDPAHPFSSHELKLAQRWTDAAATRIRTVPGRIVLSHRPCAAGGEASEAWACARNHAIDLATMDRFTLAHELAHEDQEFDGPGDPENYPTISGWSAAKKTRVSMLLHIPVVMGVNWFFASAPGERAAAEVGADAGAMCAAHPHWLRWWRVSHRRRDGSVEGTENDTPYQFRAGPGRYAAICAELRRRDRRGAA